MQDVLAVKVLEPAKDVLNLIEAGKSGVKMMTIVYAPVLSAHREYTPSRLSTKKCLR